MRNSNIYTMASGPNGSDKIGASNHSINISIYSNNIF
jgi:hypothetical protein